MPALIQSACEALTRLVGTSAIDGLHDGTSGTGLRDFTFVNAGNAPLLLHRLDVLNKLALSRKTEPIPIGIDLCIHDMIVKSIDLDGQLRWSVVDGVLQLLELDNFASLFRHRHSDRCHFFFSQLIHYFTPSSGLFLANFDGDRFSVACGCRAFKVVMPLCTLESRYEQLVQQFLCDCVENLELVSTSINFSKP
ncbi:unnamed protein product [Toxocara canis]|uniref:Uncharacterized protein n=1 Tax=Toxocara canis TaxID=6265 RepID=A0A183U581_TOXCA|nr:unnamed protein product [Toxocara canis]